MPRSLLALCILFWLNSNLHGQRFEPINYLERDYPFLTCWTWSGFQYALYGGYAERNIYWRGPNLKYETPYFFYHINYAGKTLTISAVNLENHKSYFHSKSNQMHSLSSESLDNLFESELVVERITMRYDSIGRLVERIRYNRERSGVECMDTARLQYAINEKGIKLNIRNIEWQKSEKGGYQSVIAGTNYTLPILITSTTQVSKQYDKEGHLICQESDGQKYANNIQDYVPDVYFHTYKWDDKGRIVLQKDSTKTKGLTDVNNWSYTESAFNYYRDQNRFPVLKSMAISRWLLRAFNRDSLSLLFIENAKAPRMAGTYIMYRSRHPILKLDTMVYENGTTHAEVYEFAKDSIWQVFTFYAGSTNPSDELGKWVSYGGGCVLKGVYFQAPGFLRVGDVQQIRETLIPLQHNWSVFVRLEASEGNTNVYPGKNKRFGYFPCEPYCVFFNPEGHPRYMYERNKLYKVTGIH